MARFELPLLARPAVYCRLLVIILEDSLEPLALVLPPTKMVGVKNRVEERTYCIAQKNTDAEKVISLF